jgi:hypothetical protein
MIILEWLGIIVLAVIGWVMLITAGKGLFWK